MPVVDVGDPRRESDESPYVDSQGRLCLKAQAGFKSGGHRGSRAEAIPKSVRS